MAYNHDPESIAHELAHGHHKIIRKQNKFQNEDRFGEDFAQAIRFYVETTLATNSEWYKEMQKQLAKPNADPDDHIAVLRHCSDFDTYVGKLGGKTLFSLIGWQ